MKKEKTFKEWCEIWLDSRSDSPEGKEALQKMEEIAKKSNDWYQIWYASSAGSKKREEAYQKMKLTEQQKKEAIALYAHLLEHPEVKNASLNAGMPICKICGRTAKDILDEGK